jgi:tetratricopeptide repeat protein 21B
MDEREEMANDRDLTTTASFMWHISQFKKAG